MKLTAADRQQVIWCVTCVPRLTLTHACASHQCMNHALKSLLGGMVEPHRKRRAALHYFIDTGEGLVDKTCKRTEREGGDALTPTV